MNIDQNIAQAEEILNHVFTNKALCAEALQMRSPFAHLQFDGQYHMVENNKCLAILGDTVAAVPLCRKWYESHDRLAPVVWDGIRKDDLGNVGLAKLGNALGVGKAIVTAPGHEGAPGVKMIATALEALMGGVYLDGGLAALERVIDHIGLGDSVVTLKLSFPQLYGLLPLTNMLLLAPVTWGTLAATAKGQGKSLGPESR